MIKRLRETGSVDPKPHGGGRRSIVGEEGIRIIHRLLEEAPEATLDQLCDMYRARRDIRISRATMSRAVLKLRNHSVAAPHSGRQVSPVALHGMNALRNAA
jgi:transposase